MTLAVPSASALLEVWEAGECEHAIDRALTMLGAFTGERRDALAALGVHVRDALLVESRILAFGNRLAGVTACSACDCEVELELELASPGTALVEGGTLEVEGHAVAFRVPTSFDLAAVVASADPAAGERLLQSSCIERGESLDPAALTAIDNAIEALCAPATIDIVAACPACEAKLSPPVDIVTILWAEIATYARRLLYDVDALAQRYGWSECDILALPDVRRGRYLEGVW